MQVPLKIRVMLLIYDYTLVKFMMVEGVRVLVFCLYVNSLIFMPQLRQENSPASGSGSFYVRYYSADGSVSFRQAPVSSGAGACFSGASFLV